MDKLVNYVEKLIDDIIPGVIFGIRAKGEPVKQPTFRTSYPENQPSEFDWYQEFRVGSLHNVNQKVYFEAK